jgi:steroid delta-isomerase-like uncharacterized protein
MSDDRNQTVVRDCLENAARGNYAALSDLVAADYVLHPEGIRGVDGLTEMVKNYRRAVPNLTVTIDQQFSSGEFVATRSTFRGTHDGELMGTPATGRDVEFTALTISRCREGRIEEEWELADTVTLLAQIGALPVGADA